MSIVRFCAKFSREWPRGSLKGLYCLSGTGLSGARLVPGCEACPASRCTGRYDCQMSATHSPRLLLSIIELGGYPNFTPLYEELGYEVVIETRMRKAISFLKQRKPDVIVAEFNFQSDFRDRTSSLESLLAVVQRLPSTRVIVFYEREFTPQFDKLRARLPVHAAIAFPVEAGTLRELLLQQQADGGD